MEAGLEAVALEVLRHHPRVDNRPGPSITSIAGPPDGA